jgi:DNA-binding transcriptional MocR family regulator
MRAIYGGRRAALIAGLVPLAARGWTWPGNPAGMHLLLSHKRGDYVRSVAESSSLDLALLHSYRARKARDDGLLLRFGALDAASLQRGIAALAAAATRRKR